ncbi:helix-turn-helix domain-containing protein [Chitinasiproducens palmae]|uniref:helix-turn-helix domain-containing protein n=1 Tax=Chitinasiproducens palmae TaxID=1770053 RepID=UPI000B822420|nr:helix-turn-helix domain-containing protein [Chitinasiproducens palmae]
MSEKLNAQEAAAVVGVSARQVYALASPNGPIPCYRIGGRIIFDKDDLNEYLKSCRFIETKRAVDTCLSSTRVSMDSESALERSFRKLGVEPKRRRSERESERGSTTTSATAIVPPTR